MIKYFYGNHKVMDSKDILENVNRYMRLRERSGYEDRSNDYLYMELSDLEQLTLEPNIAYEISPVLSVESSSGMKLFIKRVIRKLIQWAFKDIIARQVVFNSSVVRYINAEVLMMRALSDECISLNEENESLRDKLNELKYEMEKNNEY